MPNVEANLINAVLTNRDIALVLQSSTDDLFVTHRDIWDYLREYYIKYKSVPPGEDVELKFRNFNYKETATSTQYNLDELVNEYIENNVRSLLKNAANDISNGKTKKALGDLSNGVSELSRTSAAVHDLNLADFEDSVAYFLDQQTRKANGVTGVLTDIRGFDACLPAGLGAGMLSILLAFPSIGKSWLALYMAVQAWRQGRIPMIISLEMTEHEVRNRLYTLIGQGKWSHRALVRGDIDIDEFKEWAKHEFIGKPHFHIISTEGLGEVTPDVIRGKIDQYKPDFLVVDYLQLMGSNRATENEVVRVKSISREMKLLALSEQIPVILIASATPDDNTNMQAPPALGQVSWSKQIAYDADIVLAMGRELSEPEMEIVFRKNRHGPLGDFGLQVDFDAGIFTYLDLEDVL